MVSSSPRPLLPRSLGSLLLPVLMSEHDGGMTQGTEKHGQPLPSGLGALGEAHAVLGYEPDTPMPSLPVPSSLWSIPQGLCSCCSFCQQNFQLPLRFGQTPLSPEARSSLGVGEAVPSALGAVAPSPVLSKPISRTRLRHDV